MTTIEKTIYEENPSMIRAVFLKEFVRRILPKFTDYIIFFDDSRIHLSYDKNDDKARIIHVEGKLSFLPPHLMSQIVSEELYSLAYGTDGEAKSTIVEESIQIAEELDKKSEREEKIDYLASLKRNLEQAANAQQEDPKDLEQEAPREQPDKRINFQKK